MFVTVTAEGGESQGITVVGRNSRSPFGAGTFTNLVEPDAVRLNLSEDQALALVGRILEEIQESRRLRQAAAELGIDRGA